LSSGKLVSATALILVPPDGGQAKTVATQAF